MDLTSNSHLFICFKKKTPKHVANVIMMFNHALLEFVYSHRLLFLQCAIFMVVHTVT